MPKIKILATTFMSMCAILLLLNGCVVGHPVQQTAETPTAPVPAPPKPQPPKPAPPRAVIPKAITGEEVRVFQWPPPKASSTYAVPLANLSRRPHTLADADGIISKALDQAGYEEKQYYQLPEKEMPGFVLVTRVEAINKDGSPKQPDRWPSGELSLLGSDFSVGNVLKVLLHMEAGRYRVIAFVFTANPVQQDSGKQLTEEEAQAWLSSGWDSLPDSIGSAPFTNKKNFCTALVYEFEKKSNKGKPKLKLPGLVSAKRHIEKAGIFK
ncbi:MAG: hypothetical protein PHE17_12050 [Thiothrix sp.]|uniref:hypothetical protein n=1 Tax=Thiothrix sp. TaxID=1032 RepID=UPI00261F87D1|nr:hypothetical protein [Thiothrix sp.]MDD5393742.1 hypothetical protein [Thiothrix sp.]